MDDVRNAPPNAAIQNLDQTRLESARRGFLAIPGGTEFSLRSKYFIGTIHTLRAEYLDAIAAFSGVLGQEPRNDEESRSPRAHLPGSGSPALRDRPARAGDRGLPRRAANLSALRPCPLRACLDLHPSRGCRAGRARARSTLGRGARQPSERRWEDPPRRPPGACRPLRRSRGRVRRGARNVRSHS